MLRSEMREERPSSRQRVFNEYREIRVMKAAAEAGSEPAMNQMHEERGRTLGREAEHANSRESEKVKDRDSSMLLEMR